MKTLNLDALAKVERVVTLDGVDHEVTEMSVEDFVAGVREAEELEKKGGAGLAENTEQSVKHLKRFLPTVPVERLRKLKLPQLKALVDFVNGVLEEEAKNGEDASGN